MDQSEPASASNLNDEFETIYDQLEEADIKPPSERAIAFAWFVSIVSGSVLLISAYCLHMWWDQVRFYFHLILFLLLLPWGGVFCGPVWFLDLRSAPDRRRQQIEKQDMLRNGRYSVTSGVGVYGITKAGKFGVPWVDVGSVRLHGFARRHQGEFLRVSHSGDTILRVEKRIAKKKTDHSKDSKP